MELTLHFFVFCKCAYDKSHCGNVSICQFSTNKVFAQIS